MTEEPRRTVLVLAYEFPPSAGGGVQRIAKLVRYLPRYGLDPVVLAGTPVPGRPFDDTLAEEVAGVPVVRLPSRHVSAAIARALRVPKRIAARLGLRSRRSPGATARTAGEGVSAGAPLSTRLARFVTMDDASLWSRAAVRAGLRLARQHGCSVVLATGQPYSTVLAAATICRRSGLPLVVDMRDPWLANPSTHWPTSRRRARVERAARDALRLAAATVATSEPIAREAGALGARDVRVITNGYDAEDVPQRSPDPRGPLRVAFMGTFYGLTDPAAFLEGFAAAGKDGEEKPLLDVVGAASDRVRELVERLAIADRVRFFGYLPHRDALRVVAAADVGLVTVAEVPGGADVYPGKLFEYLGMRIPVLAVVPESGVAADLVRRSRGGWVVSPSDPGRIAALVSELAERKRSGGLVCEFDESVVAGLERKRLTHEYATVLRAVSG